MVKRSASGSAKAQPNMHDVARVAGVSQMTVSRVMRGAGYISDDVKEEVLRAARQIGYVHNRLAGGNATYDNPIVGVVVPTLKNRVFTEVLAGITDGLGESGLRPVFGVSDYSLEAEEDLVFDLLSWRPKGLILSGLEHTDALRAIIAQTGVKVAEVMDVDGDPIFASFGVSHTKAGQDMARHLIGQGYRTFGYIGSQGGSDLRAKKRFEAFATVLREAGAQLVAVREAEGESSMGVGRKMTDEVLRAKDPPRAIYYANDDLAAGGMMHCLAENVAMPGDVALAGFNGLGFLDSLPLKLTTTVTPRFEIGKEAATWLASSAPSGTATGALLEARLDVGETT